MAYFNLDFNKTVLKLKGKALLNIGKLQTNNELENLFIWQMVVILIGHINDVIKMFKLTSRYAGCFTAKCWIFCDIISIVYKSVHRGKL